MENASKALIIAGAILLSIIIIGLGIGVVTNARKTIDGANVSDTEVETYNSKITAYVGTNKKQTDVRNVCSAILSMNGSNKTNNTGRPEIKLNGNSISSLPVGSNMKASTNFTINIGIDTETGYVNNVTIDPNPNV